MQEININQQLADVNQQFRQLFSTLDKEQVNTVPFAGSWTPAQVAEHVLKSEAGMLKALQAPGAETSRNAFEKVEHLKRVFLDFTTKMKSPDMVVPELKEYSKDELLQELASISGQLSETIPLIHNSELVTGLPTGDLTKGEIIHFLLYHTKRHIHQLECMVQTISANKKVISTKESVIRKVNDAFSKNDMPGFMSCCTDDITWNMVGNSITKGKDAILKMMATMPGDCPDITVDTVISEGDKAACTGTFTMKNKEGIPVLYRFCDIYYFNGDNIRVLDSYVVEMKQ